MQVIDQIYHCQMPTPSFGIWHLQCRLRIYQPHPDVQTVMISDMGFELGWFIPNLVEHLAEQVVHEFQLDPAKLIWIEHYTPESRYLTSTDFSQVVFEWQNGKARNPEWVAISLAAIQSLTAQPELQLANQRDQEASINFQLTQPLFFSAK